MRKHVALFAATLALAACGGEKPTGQTSTATSGDEVADRLEDAADQSGPRAKQVLENAADEAREHPSLAPVEKPGSFAQEAMEKAGKAEAAGTPPAAKP
jgi:ABC-type glycerol-3-phosphate transport system substrate-binding protein